jgi:peptide chain release factor 2
MAMFERIQKEIKELEEIRSLAKQEPEFLKEAALLYRKIRDYLRGKEREAYLLGEYDENNAILIIQAGAGGQDAQDWARLLLRMYERFCQRKGWQAKIISQSFGQGVWEGEPGIKEVTLEIKGKFAYGFLKGEAGVHRLVRSSPFSAKKLRHTSFALVEVVPLLPETKKEEIKIRDQDLKIETFRASGPGGQYVNRRETAVRIVHLPTGIVATCQSERLQGLNKKKAMEVLYSKLYKLKLEEKEKEVSKIKGRKISPAWGNQIRSYIFFPYKLVKDHRTGVETKDVERVLEGEIDQFIEAEIKLKENPKTKDQQPNS